MSYPDLSGIIVAEDISTIGSGSYAADYVNWARTMNLLHKHATGWLPFMAMNNNGGHVFTEGATCYLMIGFRNPKHGETPCAPQAIMDNRNNSIPYAKVTSRDITDTHRRGVCMAAAMFFGLAYELWGKITVESGYAHAEQKQAAPKGPSMQREAQSSEQKAAAAKLKSRSTKALATLGKYCSDEEIEDIKAQIKSAGGTTEEQVATLEEHAASADSAAEAV